MQSLLSSWFVQGMIKATSDMWLKSWDERNGGNVSLCLTPEDVAPYRAEFNPQPRSETLSAPVPALAGSYFLVTGSGKFFRNVQFSPADSLTLLQLNEEGTGYRILWGLIAGGGGIAYLRAGHAPSVPRCAQAGYGRRRSGHHALPRHQPYRLELDTARFTRELWEGSTECLVVFPDGVGIIPWMFPGTDGIGAATSEKMHAHSLVLWPFHGIFAQRSLAG